MGGLVTSLKGWWSQWVLGYPPFPSGGNHLEVGQWGEAVAARRLELEGCRVLARRYVDSQRRDIDLIAADSLRILFIEVKARPHHDPFPLEDVFEASRMGNLARAAGSWLAATGNRRRSIRFDAMAVLHGAGDSIPFRIVREMGYLDPATVPGWLGTGNQKAS